MDKLISVIIPTYGRSSYFISKALSSVFAQTYHKIEIIVVNDNDKGSSQYFEIKNFCATFCNVLYFETNHLGSCIARNYAVEKSTGEYIAFLDDDDVWFSQKLEIQLQYFKLDTGIVFSNGFWVYTNVTPEKRKVYRTPENFKKVVSFQDLLLQNYVGTTSQIMIRKSVFLECGGFDKNFVARHDYDLYLRVSQKYRIIGAPDFLFEHYVHGESQIIKDNRKSLIGYKLLYKTYKSAFEKNHIAKSNITYKISRSAFNERRYFFFIKYMIISVINNPLNAKQIIQKIFNGKTF